MHIMQIDWRHSAWRHIAINGTVLGCDIIRRVLGRCERQVVNALSPDVDFLIKTRQPCARLHVFKLITLVSNQRESHGCAQSQIIRFMCSKHFLKPK